MSQSCQNRTFQSGGLASDDQKRKRSIDQFCQNEAVGHNLPQEAPHAFAEAMVDVAEI
jgi:hypothetical protein